ncbi:hypothetical protein [Salinibacter altiplanensis]|uniref:hypothetical protein n=1 Tax=Salinibacter altiplanensis TaxID=1803181 RepID=UPI000C9F509E|nr:hypothetical protein [Salinibacter altiplanensis]
MDYFRGCGYERIERETLPETIRQAKEVARLCPASATCTRKHLSTADTHSAEEWEAYCGT